MSLLEHRATAPVGDSSAGRPSPLEWILCLYLPFLAVVALTFAATPDDAFITLRFAANLVHGYGLAFNRGVHVQGFTSPLDLVVAVVAYLLPGGFTLLKMKIASLIFGLLAIREAGMTLFGIAIPRWASRVGCLTVALCPVIGFASGNALETTLEMWLLMAVARRLVVTDWRRSIGGLAGISFAAVLARPDAIAPLACMALAGLLIERQESILHRVSWFAGALLAVVVTVAAELAYFGSALPNTYYAKDLPLGRALRYGATYLDSLLQPVGYIGQQLNVVTLLEALLLLAGTWAVCTRFARCGYLLAIIVGQALFVLKSGGDWMIGGRFLAPAAIPFIVLEVLGALVVADVSSRWLGPRAGRSPAMASAILLLATSIIPLNSVHTPAWEISGVDDKSLLASGQYPQLSALWAGLPSVLSCVAPGSTVATSEVGYLGFVRLDLRMLDLRGLTDSAIARSAPDSLKQPGGVDDPEWYESTSPVGAVLLRAKPSVIVEFEPSPEALALGGTYRLARTLVFDRGSVYIYVPVHAPGICPA